MIPYYDPNSLVMGARNGTPLRLVSPAPVLTGGAARPFAAPQPAAPTAPQAAQLTGITPFYTYYKFNTIYVCTYFVYLLFLCKYLQYVLCT